MSTFHVRLQSAAGRVLDLAVRASSERRATTAAIREAESRHPGAGWFPIYVLS